MLSEHPFEVNISNDFKKVIKDIYYEVIDNVRKALRVNCISDITDIDKRNRLLKSSLITTLSKVNINVYKFKRFLCNYFNNWVINNCKYEPNCLIIEIKSINKEYTITNALRLIGTVKSREVNEKLIEIEEIFELEMICLSKTHSQ